MLTPHPLVNLNELDGTLARSSMPAETPRRPGTLFGALRLLREPVPEEKKRLMRARWESLDPRWRTLGQGLGQQATGCGATIGVHPRCDFACTACYLGAEANRRPSDRPRTDVPPARSTQGMARTEGERADHGWRGHAAARRGPRGDPSVRAAHWPDSDGDDPRRHIPPPASPPGAPDDERAGSPRSRSISTSRSGAGSVTRTRATKKP